MKRSVLMMPVVALAMTGCADVSDFEAIKGMTGEQVYQAACADCHTRESGSYFTLSGELATVEGMSAKIHEGGMVMPSFPGITGAELKALSEYVLANSKVE